MKATVTQPQSWQRVIAIEIPNEEIQKEFDIKLGKYKRDVKIPGFRPGKVPSALLKSRFGPAIRVEVLEDLMQKSFRDACSENNIVPITEAKISDVKTKDNEPVNFTITVEVDPPVSITGYKKLKIKTTTPKIKDADVDNALEDLRERLAEYKDIDRASKKGDHISMEYLSATVNGKPEEGLKAPQYPIEIGKGTLKDFDKGLVGLMTGEEADLSVKFPKDYHISTIAGQTAELKIKVTKLQEKILPEVNEEFCKKAGDYADVDALRAAIRTDLETQAKEHARTESYNKAIDAIIDANTIDIPPSRVEYYLDKVMEEQARYYPGGQKPDREEIDKQFREIGLRALKRLKIIEFVANNEKIKATQEEVDKRIQAIADHYQQPFEETKAALRKNGVTTRIREEIREQKTLDSLIGELPWEEN